MEIMFSKTMLDVVRKNAQRLTETERTVNLDEEPFSAFILSTEEVGEKTLIYSFYAEELNLKSEKKYFLYK